MTIRRTEIDGVPTLFAEHSGPYRAGLVFRVGRADESFARSGITHLLEHLTLFPLGIAEHNYNGCTGPVTTTFTASGTEDEVVTFLGAVCQNLAKPPLERLVTEKSILKTEWANRAEGADSSIASWRYGAKGYGLMSFSEPGLSMVTAEELLAWSSTWFTRQNAALWICGERLPGGIVLDLPAGTRRRVPTPTSALPSTPAFYVEGDKAVVFNSVLADRPAVAVFARVLERTLYRDLRHDAGISYTATAATCARGDGQTSLTALVDALPDQAGAAVGGMVDVLAKLRAGRVEQRDVDAHITGVAEAAEHPDAEACLLPSAAFDLLTDQPLVLDVESYLADLRSVTVEQVRQVAVEASANALLLVPGGTAADWAGFTAAPTTAESMVAGTVHPSIDQKHADLIIGPDGVSSRFGSDRGSTVRFDELAALLRWPDGACQLVGDDGFMIRIEPTLYRIDPTQLGAALSSVDPEKIIAMPERDPDRIPKPAATSPSVAARSAQRGGASGFDRLPAWQRVLLVCASIPSLFMLGITVILVMSAFSSDPSERVEPAVPVVSLVLGILVTTPVLRLARWMIRRSDR